MSKIYTSVEELIGKTPLLELTNIEKKYDLKARLLAKLEFFNPAGSAKDRVAKAMLDEAVAQGLVDEDTVIIEPTSGNTGIGLAAVGASRGYRVIIIMPDSMSVERQKLMRAYGAEVVLTDGSLGMSACIKKAEELAKTFPKSYIPGQFTNPVNSKAHFMTTGPEIWEDTEGEVDIFVAGVGTGGTITGTGEFLKSKKEQVQVVGVEPDASPLLSKGYAGSHKLQGIGANFVPEVFNQSITDEIIPVSDEAAYVMGRELGHTEGLFVGISAGAAVYAAIELAKREENAGKTIVVLIPDSGDHYLSTPDYI